MTIALQFCNITVNDVDESIPFYEALGLAVQNDVKSGEFRWVTMGSDAQPGLGIVLSAPHAGRSKENGDLIQELLVKGELPMMVFRTDDLDGLFETAWWHRGRCLAYGDGVAYWALAEMVRMRARIAEDEPADESLTKLSAVLAQIVADQLDREGLETEKRRLEWSRIRSVLDDRTRSEAAVTPTGRSSIAKRSVATSIPHPTIRAVATVTATIAVNAHGNLRRRRA